MTKRAFCVGLNDYPIDGADLQGCVNDAHAWAKLLVGHYDFAAGDVTVLLDADATKRNMVKGLKALMKGAQKGDVLVFTNSSHGTYAADRTTGGDEADRYDEAICPWDTKTELLRDDELRVLFDDLPAGVRLTVISDSCYSGSVTRNPPATRRPRFIRPALLGRPERSTPPPRNRGRSQSSMAEVLLTGCRSDQVSYDAKIGRAFRGAMSYHAQKVIKDAGYRLTYRELHERLVPALVAARFDQEPQLEGRSANLRRQVFT